MAAKAKLIRAKDVLAKHLEDPEFRAEWERSAPAQWPSRWWATVLSTG